MMAGTNSDKGQERKQEKYSSGFVNKDYLRHLNLRLRQILATLA